MSSGSRSCNWIMLLKKCKKVGVKNSGFTIKTIETEAVKINLSHTYDTTLYR